MADSAVQVEVAEAVKNILAANKFGHTFEPERSYADWDLELARETGTLVDLVGIVLSSEFLSRKQVSYRVAVDIAVRRRFGLAEQSAGRIDVGEIDKLCKLVQDIHEHFCNPDNARLPAYSNATWQETSIKSVATKDHLKLSQFTGIVQLIYEVVRTL